MSKLKILITGASGMVGREVFNQILKRVDEFEISLLLRKSRKNIKNFREYQDKIKIIWGTLHNHQDINEAVFDQDVILHIAAVLPDIANYNPELAKETNVEGTRKINESVLKQQKRAKLIYTSSVAVYGDRRENPYVKITDPIEEIPHDIYTETKIKAERIIKESGIIYSIFRLSYVVSVNMLKFRPILFHMPLDTPVEIIHAKDVGLALINALKTDEIWGKTFNLSGGRNCQIIFRDHLNDILEIMGFGRDFLPDKAFYTGRFHCGFYDEIDMQEIQNLLNFQRFSLNDFYLEVKKWIGVKRYFIPLVKPILRWYILNKSEFYKSK